jgi:uncharacterized repeat protein (TIGR01451 family)
MRRTVALATGILILVPLLAGAQQKGDIVVTNSAEVEVLQKKADGKTETVRVEAAKANVAPGDVVIFTTRYTNKGKQPATGVVVTNPVPEHMTYVDLSAEGKGSKVDFSIDGGRTYAAPEKLKVTDKDGRTRPALPRDYTHIQWTITGSLQPGAGGYVTFRARVK